jgi:spore maturation protein B
MGGIAVRPDRGGSDRETFMPYPHGQAQGKGVRLMLTQAVIPSIIAFIILYGLIKKTPVFEAFLEGAKDGLQTVIKIFPALVALLTAVSMFKHSGVLEMLVRSAAPGANLIGVPEEVVPLAFMRPVSGSGALAMFQDLIAVHGADSTIGRTAAVLMGSSETTFYTIAVYYGSVNVSKTRHTLAAALTGDAAGLIGSAIAVRLLF